jgi:hypothetical protein
LDTRGATIGVSAGVAAAGMAGTCAVMAVACLFIEERREKRTSIPIDWQRQT